MKVFCPVAALVILAGTAWGGSHEVSTYFAHLEVCYVKSGSSEQRLACVGRMADACSEGEEGGHSTLGTALCINAETEIWDSLLIEEYRETQEWVRARDKAEAQTFPEFAKRVETLMDAQLAWIAFRDASCGFVYAEWGAGSMRSVVHADCMRQMTAERTIELRDIREGDQ